MQSPRPPCCPHQVGLSLLAAALEYHSDERPEVARSRIALLLNPAGSGELAGVSPLAAAILTLSRAEKPGGRGGGRE